MNILFEGKKPGQCGVSTIAIATAARLAFKGYKVLYIPVSNDIGYIRSWLGLKQEKDLTKSISIMYKFIEESSIKSSDTVSNSVKINENLWLLDTRNTDLTDDMFKDVVSYILGNYKGKDSKGAMFEYVIWDLTREKRSNYVKAFLREECDYIVDVRSQNQYIYDEVDEELESMQSKVIVVNNRTTFKLESQNPLLKAINKFKDKSINIRNMSYFTSRQNRGEMIEQCIEMFNKPDYTEISVVDGLDSIVKRLVK